METVLALDIGDKRIGVATSQGSLARPLGWLSRAQGEAERKLLAMVGEQQVGRIIVGLPLSAEGAITPQTVKTFSFARRLARRCGVALQFVDEFASTHEASEAALSREQRKKGVLDALAASILLQAFLEGRAVPVDQGVLDKLVELR